MNYYRIVEIKNGKPYSLFHATRGSREIPTDTWVKCDKKVVRDGSNNYYYDSGFHAIEGFENATHFFDTMFRVKKNRYIVPCSLRGNIRPKHDKPMKRACVLADEIFIGSKDIERALFMLRGGQMFNSKSEMRRVNEQKSTHSKILRNRCKCAKCGDIIESKFRHDWVQCKCGAIFTDGGTDYIHRGAMDLNDIIDMTECLGGPDECQSS